MLFPDVYIQSACASRVITDDLFKYSKFVEFNDCIVEPVLFGITERLVLKSERVLIYPKYQLYVGNTPFTDIPLPTTQGVITAYGGFEGKDTIIRFYSTDDVEMAKACLTVLNFWGIKRGKIERSI